MNIKKFSLFIIVVILILINTTPVFAIIATITGLPEGKLNEKVAIKKTENDENFVTPKINDQIQENGVIVTGKGKNATAEILVEDHGAKAILKLGSNTYLKLSPEEDLIKVLLEDGKVVVQNKNNLNLNVYVGNYVAASEGTTFMVEVLNSTDNLDELDVEVEVLEGKVRFHEQNATPDKMHFIMPGERAKFKFRMQRIPQHLQTKHLANLTSLKQLREHNLIEPERLQRLENNLKFQRQKKLALKEHQIHDIDLKKAYQQNLYNIKSPVMKENRLKIQRNISLQRSGRLKNYNDKARKSFKEKLNRKFNLHRNIHHQSNNLNSSQKNAHTSPKNVKPSQKNTHPKPKNVKSPQRNIHPNPKNVKPPQRNIHPKPKNVKPPQRSRKRHNRKKNIHKKPAYRHIKRPKTRHNIPDMPNVKNK